MSVTLAQVATPSEGLDSGLLLPLYLLIVIFAAGSVLARVLEGREDQRADTVDDANFAILLLAGVYVIVLAIFAIGSEFDLLADMVQIMAIMIAFFAVLVVALLGVELLVGLGGKRRRRGVEVPPASTDGDSG